MNLTPGNITVRSSPWKLDMRDLDDCSVHGVGQEVDYKRRGLTVKCICFD